MGLFGQQGFEQRALLVVDQDMNIVGNTDSGGVHRLTSHALDYGNAWNDDTRLAHPDDQPLDQDLPVGKTNGFPCKPCCQFSSPWAGEVAIVVAPLDNGELFVPGLNAARELRDNLSFNANLLGDMVEHDRREQFAFEKVTPGIAQATELERLAKPSFWGPCIGNGGKVGGLETMVLDNSLFGVRQCQPRRDRKSVA